MGSTAANTAGAQPIPEAGNPRDGAARPRTGTVSVYQHHPPHHLRPMQHPFCHCRPASHWHRAPSGHHLPHSCRHHSTSSLLRTGTFHAAGCIPFRTGTPDASGDRIPVPDGVERPRPQRNVPDGVECHPG